MIPFNKTIYLDKSLKYIEEVVKGGKCAGDGKYTKLCSDWLAGKTGSKVLLTTSGTAALEMAAILLDIHEGDEVIMPSYTFVSTANAFVLQGAKIIFVDIRPDTMNIDETKIEGAITDKTKAIVVVHYAGVSCDMNKIMSIAREYDLQVVEDAAQGVMSCYNERPLGTIGTLGCYSFHETKNYTMGEGGALVINDEIYEKRAEIIREKGTDRARFFRGEIDKYSWVDKGSSYLPSDLNAAFLYPQLEIADEINQRRLKIWSCYYKMLEHLEEKGKIERPVIPKECIHNAHMFYIKVRDLEERTKLISYLRTEEIGAVFHYVPLHSAKVGKIYGELRGDIYTTKESERLLRLPLYYELSEKQVSYIVSKIYNYFGVNI